MVNPIPILILLFLYNNVIWVIRMIIQNWTVSINVFWKFSFLNLKVLFNWIDHKIRLVFVTKFKIYQTL